MNKFTATKGKNITKLEFILEMLTKPTSLARIIQTAF